MLMVVARSAQICGVHDADDDGPKEHGQRQHAEHDGKVRVPVVGLEHLVAALHQRRGAARQAGQSRGGEREDSR